MKNLAVPVLLGICMITACSSSMPGAAPDVALSASSLMFGQEIVGTNSTMQPVTLSNTGVGTLKIMSIVASSNFQVTTTCGATLAPGASCAINVTFTPSVSGGVDGKVSVADNAVGSPHTVLLTGTGSVGGPRCTTKGMQCPAQFPPCCPGLSCVPASTRAFCE
jgi:hypothetical protein